MSLDVGVWTLESGRWSLDVSHRLTPDKDQVAHDECRTLHADSVQRKWWETK